MEGNSLFKFGCQCDFCLTERKKIYNKSFKEWQEGKRGIQFEYWEYSCDDGCCSDYGTNVYVNGFQLPCDGEDTTATLEMMMKFLKQGNVSIEYDSDYKN